jgi:hypothetical protein
MENENKTIDTMTKNELIDVLWQALNKANLKGVFNINEAYLLKIVHTKLIEGTNVPS